MRESLAVECLVACPVTRTEAFAVATAKERLGGEWSFVQWKEPGLAYLRRPLKPSKPEPISIMSDEPGGWRGDGDGNL